MAQRRAEFPEPATRDHRSEGTERAQSGPIDFVLRALAAQEKWLERDIRSAAQQEKRPFVSDAAGFSQA